MVFSSITFLFFFLPLVLLTVFAVGNRFRNLALLFFSLVFYAWGEGWLVFLLLISICFNYVFGLAIERAGSEFGRRASLATALAVNLVLLGFYKYANFIVDSINGVLALLSLPSIVLEPVNLPIGISFFTFQAISYVVDVYRRDTEAQKNPLDLALFISMFPQLVAGPIVRYNDIARQLAVRSVNAELFSRGCTRFIVGLGKKVLIANNMAIIADDVFKKAPGDLSSPAVWLGVVAYTLQIYFDFSGYSDMAIGLGRMFGFEFLENFNYPYISQSIREFWRRWHISLSTWFRDYLYIPLGGNRGTQSRVLFNLVVVFFLTGLWHGASWNFVVWGMYHGFFLVLERLWLGDALERAWRPLRHFYAVFVVMVGWVFFRVEGLADALGYIKVMWSFSDKGADMSFFVNNVTLTALAFALLLSTPVVPAIMKWIRGGNRGMAFAAGAARVTVLAAIFLCSAMLLAAQTHNPFIYFRF